MPFCNKWRIQEETTYVSKMILSSRDRKIYRPGLGASLTESESLHRNNDVLLLFSLVSLVSRSFTLLDFCNLLLR